MKKNTITIILVSVCTLVAGYVIGAFLGWPDINNDSISGDVGKVKRHKTEVVDETDMKLLENKLKFDTDFQAQTAYTLTFMSARISEFKENAALTVQTISKYPEFQKYQQPMETLAEMSTNAQQSAEDALAALVKISNGENGTSYEDLSNKAVLAYIMLDKGLATSRDFVADADAFLKGKRVMDYEQLAFLRDTWVSYNFIQAVLDQDKTLVAYWDKAGFKLSDPQAAMALKNTPDSFQQASKLACCMNAPLLEWFNNANKLGAAANSQKLSLCNSPRLGMAAAKETLGNQAISVSNSGALRLVNASKLNLVNAKTVLTANNMIAFKDGQNMCFGMVNSDKMSHQLRSSDILALSELLSNSDVLGFI